MHVLSEFFKDAMRSAGYGPRAPKVGRTQLDGRPFGGRSFEGHEHHLEEVRDNEIKEGTEWHDAVAITSAVVVLGIAGLTIEHILHLDGDIFYDVLSVCGAHPLSKVFKTILVHVF